MPGKSRPTSNKLSSEEYERLAAFRYALRRFLRFSQEAAEASGLTGQHYQALLALRGAAAARMTINDLAMQLLIRHNSAVGLVDRLAEQGYLLRTPSEEDARKVLLLLTAKGSKVLERLADRHREELERVGSQIGRLLQQIADKPDDSRGRAERERPRRRRAGALKTGAVPPRKKAA